jgi:hypothetical protein
MTHHIANILAYPINDAIEARLWVPSNPSLTVSHWLGPGRLNAMADDGKQSFDGSPIHRMVSMAA